MHRFLFFSFLLVLALPAAEVFSKTNVIPLDKIIVIVNDDIITQIELDDRVKLISKQLQQHGNKLPPKNILSQQVLERLILEKLQLTLAKKTGIRVNDEMVNRVISNIAKENKLSLEQFQKVLAKDGFTFADFRENIRREIIISRLRKIHVENNIDVSEQEVDNFLSQNQKNKSAQDEFHLRHILIATPDAATPEQVEKSKAKAEKIIAELRAGADFTQKAIAVSNDELALKGGDMGWSKGAQLPDIFASVVGEMKKNEIRGPFQSTNGFHIIQLLDKRSNEPRHIISQTLARHILIRPTQVLSRADARLRLETIRQRIMSGEDFATLARASSDDKTSAAEGGSLGWVNPGMMVPAFEEQMNKLKPGEISQPFLTQFGWHIVQVMSRRQHDSTSEYQHSQAIQIIRKRKTDEAVQDWLRRLRAEAYVDYRMNK